MIYITGDTHREFGRIERFCRLMKTTTEDIMIILGDAGINYYEGPHDAAVKESLSKLLITLFCIHGYHEKRTQTIPSYQLVPWHGGMVWQEDEYPNLLFARDGDVYDLDGKKTIVIGGAYSVDKIYRILYNYGWFADEQPSDKIKAYVENQLDGHNWQVDVVLSHTVPLKYEPTEVFLKGIDQRQVDKSTEEWLGHIEEKLQYQEWYAGHYHTEKKVDKLRLMFESIEQFTDEDDV